MDHDQDDREQGEGTLAGAQHAQGDEEPKIFQRYHLRKHQNQEPAGHRKNIDHDGFSTHHYCLFQRNPGISSDFV